VVQEREMETVELGCRRLVVMMIRDLFAFFVSYEWLVCQVSSKSPRRTYLEVKPIGRWWMCASKHVNER